MEQRIHKKQWEFLKKAWRGGSLSHAYLFAGERELGKERVAFDLVRLVSCRGEEPPCGECASCRMVEKGVHPDVFRLGGEEGVGIGEVRELRRKMSLRPSLSPVKTALIRAAHRMSRAGQNSLLKTLEEPKGEAVIVLMTDRPHLLLRTVRSRVQTVKFFPLSRKKIRRLLREKGAEAEQASRIASLAQGKPGRALRFWREKSLLEKEERAEEEMKKVFEVGLGERFGLAKSLAKKNPRETLLRWLRFLRRDFLEEREGGKELKSRIEALDRALYLVSRTNANKKTVLQNLMLKL